jgi:hypothetical protein
MIACDNVVEIVRSVPPRTLEKHLYVEIPVLRKPKQILPPVTAVRDMIASTPFVAPSFSRHTRKSLNQDTPHRNINLKS